MKCPLCSSKTRIYNSRSSHQATQTWRRHKCEAGHLFTTREKVDWSGVTTVIGQNDSTPYSRERLLISLVRAADELTLAPEALSELCDSIENELQANNFFTEPTGTSELITTTATSVLLRFDRNLALQYVNSVYDNKPPLSLLKRLVTA